MKADSIHYSCERADGYNRPFNLVQSARSTGKTTQVFRKLYKAFMKDFTPSIVLRRQIIDITESYIIDQFKVISKFSDTPVKPYYLKSQFKEGVVDVYTSQEDLKKGEHVFLRIIGLTAKMQKLKGGVLTGVKYLVYDEFMIDVRHKEKYLPDEIMRFKELYTTYRREAVGENLICWFLGNAYSYYSPFHAYFKIPTNKIKMGCFLSGTTWTYELYQPTPELIEQLKKNPLYDLDDKYEQYALYGVAINDVHIRLETQLPRNFSLFAVFKISDNLVGVYINKGNDLKDFNFWAQELSEWKDEYRRKVLAFDISDMTSYTFIPSKSLVSMLWPIKKAIMNRTIAYKTVGASYQLELLYEMLPAY